MRRWRITFLAFLIVSLLFHAGALMFGLYHWPWLRKNVPVASVPITLLTSDELAKLVAAAEADKPQDAATEDPKPEAPPEKAPEPEPAPVPPEPKPAPKVAPEPKSPPPVPAKAAAPKATPEPAVRAAANKPTPATPVTRPDPGFKLDDLAASIRATRPAPPRPTGTPRPALPQGPSQEQLDAEKRAAEGLAKAAINDFTSGVADQLGRAWRPNCGVEGVGGLRIKVRLQLERDGRLREAKLVDYSSENAIADPVTRAAATRALSAAASSSPFRGLPPVEAYEQWKSFVVTFNGKAVCGG